MAKDLTLKHHRGTPSDVAEILKKPISQEMLNRDLARLAYVAKDGTPRVVPIAFTWNGTEVVMCTTTNAPKLASLRRNPAVALTIDTEVHPPKILLLRGEAVLDEVEGIPDEYLQMNGTYEDDSGAAGRVGDRGSVPLRLDGADRRRADVGEADRLP
jgi:Pyridoxamine 5'-phosphate oxidase